MNKIAYKVVMKVNGKYLSVMSDRLPNSFVLEYDFNKTTVPKIGKILVFNTLENAIDFIHYNKEKYLIFEGLAVNVGFPRKLSYELELESELKKFWQLKKQKKHIPCELIRETPDGSMTCDSFTPKKSYGWEELI